MNCLLCNSHETASLICSEKRQKKYFKIMSAQAGIGTLRVKYSFLASLTKACSKKTCNFIYVKTIHSHQIQDWPGSLILASFLNRINSPGLCMLGTHVLNCVCAICFLFFLRMDCKQMVSSIYQTGFYTF